MNLQSLQNRFCALILLALAATLLFDRSSCAQVTKSTSSVLHATLNESQEEAAFQARSLAIQEHVAAQNLDEWAAWQQRMNPGEPHKYSLSVLLARLSLSDRYDSQQIWNTLLKLDKEQPNLYHFRSVFDIPIFFRYRNSLPKEVEAVYRRMLGMPQVYDWMAQGTENHMFMHRSSGLALMDGSGWSNERPAVGSTNEAWLRSELNKFLTIGQGEFHSPTYYGYSIAGLLNLYDFARSPHLRQLAKAALDWYAVNTAVRLSWGTAGGAASRGFDRGTWDGSELGAVAWMWWGDSPETAKRIDHRYAQLALRPALSDYRPPAQFRALARKEVPLPFQLQASHPDYYNYHEGNSFWETFYVTSDYSLGTLLHPQRSYRTKGTINAQYATYKLVVRDSNGGSNAVVSLGGTFHNPMATGRSPGDQLMQHQGVVIYQLRLNDQDQAAKVPHRSHLVLPARYGQPQQHGNWYIWRIEQTWLCARPWGDEISWQAQVSETNQDYQALAAIGNKTAWITDVARTADYPNFEALTRTLDKTEINDRSWEKLGQIAYTSLQGHRLEMTYEPNGGISRASINGKERILKNWPVLASPYVKEELNSGLLEVSTPKGKWRLRGTLTGPKWE